jgi:SNF2 family DNA or RNA helicase
MWCGTGKTRVAVDLCSAIQAQRTLVVAPLAVIPAWKEQFELYGTGQEVILLDKGLVKDRAYRITQQLGDEPVVFVLNYDILYKQEVVAVHKHKMWDLLIFDEIHKLKLPGGQISRAAYRIPAMRRLGLSGTMMPHSPMDPYGQFRALDWEILEHRTFSSYRSRYAIMGGYFGHEIKDYRNQEELAERIASVTFSCGKDVLDLPPFTEQFVRVDLELETYQAYLQMEKTLRAEVGTGELTAANGLVKLLRLQQLTSGWVTDNEGREQVVGSEKLEALRELFDQTPRNEPWVVFCRFRRDLDQVRAAAKTSDNRRWAELSGRENGLKYWQNGGCPILAVQIQAGGVGVDLTRAAYCAFLSTGFSLGDFQQAKERVHRPGQERTTHYYYVVARGTVDEKVYGALRSKRDAVGEVIKHLQRG